MRHLLLGPEDWGLACQQLPLQHSGQCVLAQWSHNPKAIHLLQIFAHTPSRPPEDSADFSLTVPVDAVADRGAGLLLPSGVRLWTTPTVSMASQVQVCGTSSALSLASLGRLMPGLAVCPGTVVRLGDCELKVLAVDELSPRQWASCGLSTAFQLVASAAPAATASTATEPTPEPQSPLQPVAGLDEALAQLCAMLELPFARGAHFQRLGLDCPRGLLLYGPPGCGKTLLVRTAAAQCSAKLISASAQDILGEYLGESEARLRALFNEAEQATATQPTVLFLDELDALCPKREESGSHESRLVAQLLTLMDGIRPQRKLVVVGATNRVNSIDEALRRPGRFEREIAVDPPDEQARRAILEVHTKHMRLATDVDLSLLAKDCLSYVGADLAALCREAGIVALRAGARTISQQHFATAQKYIVPSGRRDVETRATPTRWEDIGGLETVKEALVQAAEWPLVYRDTFFRLGLSPPRGILLYGPPGCSKTTLVRAVATSTNATFIALSGAQIYSPFVGDSERAIRSAFKQARTYTPSVLFLDEVDAIVGRRSAESTGGRSANARVLSTILNEMDGIETAGHVLVIAATNRPDLLDAAFLRPGRMDRIIYVPPPDLASRTAILRVKLQGTPVAEDVNLQEVAAATEHYTGADLESLVREAAILALREDIGNENLRIGARHFHQALKTVQPSLTPAQIEFYASRAPTVPR